MDQHTNIDELIVKCLAEEASVLEKQQVSRWLELSDANKKYYSDIEAIYEAAGKKTPEDKKEVDHAWEKFNARITGQQQEEQSPLKRLFLSFYSKAAAILVLVSIGYFIYSTTNREEKEIVLAPALSEVLRDRLSDGTQLTLNPKSTLAYSPSFNRENREVKLSGEARFHVPHNSSLPFIVDAGNVFIKDIGTIFTVKAHPSDSVVEVAVEEGEVVFYSAKDPGISLVQNETGIYNRLSATFWKKKNTELNASSQTFHTFSFESASLKTVTDTLSKVYGAQLVLSCKTLESLKLTASFTESSVDPIVETIAETFDLQVTRNGKTITLDKAPCKNN